MHATKLKFRDLYARSSTKGSFRPHLVDLDYSWVNVRDDDPANTRYKFRWYCGEFSRDAHPIFMSKLPEGVDLCKKCLEMARIRVGLLPPGWWKPVAVRPSDATVHPLVYVEWVKQNQRRIKRQQAKEAPF